LIGKWLMVAGNTKCKLTNLNSNGTSLYHLLIIILHLSF